MVMGRIGLAFTTSAKSRYFTRLIVLITLVLSPSVQAEQCSSAFSEWRKDTFNKYGKILDLSQGREVLQELNRVNAELEVKRFSVEELLAKKLIEPGPEETSPATKSYRSYLVPKAQTGFYFPKAKLDPRIHKGIVIFIPGIGTNYSNAKSLLPVAKGFGDRSFRAEFEDVRGKGGNPIIDFRLYPVVVDMPLNGFGAKAVGSLASADGTISVLRHMHLIIKSIFGSDIPDMIVGRSQGGLVGLAYAQKYLVTGGVFGINPSPVELQTLKESVIFHEEHLTEVLKNSDKELKFHPPAWTAYRLVTLDYDLSGPNISPTFIAYSNLDRSYPQPRYVNKFLKPYVADHPNNRIMKEYTPKNLDAESLEAWVDDFSHDLIRRPVKGKTTDNFIRMDFIKDLRNFFESNVSGQH